MEVNIKKSDNTTPFGLVENGAVFLTKDARSTGDVFFPWMRIEEHILIDNGNSIRVNAVSLDCYGSTRLFDTKEEVIVPKSASINVEI